MSCLFVALARFIPGTTATQLRHDICDHLSENPMLNDLRASEYVKIETGETLEIYIKRMRSTLTWGGALEIKAFCDMQTAHCFIWLNNGNKIEFTYNSARTTRRVVHISWNGSHFEARNLPGDLNAQRPLVHRPLSRPRFHPYMR